MPTATHSDDGDQERGHLDVAVANDKNDARGLGIQGALQPKPTAWGQAYRYRTLTMEYRNPDRKASPAPVVSDTWMSSTGTRPTTVPLVPLKA